MSACQQVQYQGSRRFKLLTVDNDSQPYPVAAATWLDDEASPDPTQQQLVDTLELDVFQLLKQVAKYSQQLATTSSSSSSSSSGGSGGGQYLPDAVLTYAPPPPGKRSVAEYLIQTKHPAGDRIATWQRMGSMYGDAAVKKKPAQDPYQVCPHVLCTTYFQLRCLCTHQQACVDD
jgi:hypothetical protein